jgi:hypothetical protein
MKIFSNEKKELLLKMVLGLLCFLSRSNSLQSESSVKRKLCSSKVKTASELQKIVGKSALRQPGSKNYKRSWTHWLFPSVDSIRYELAQVLPDPVNEEELKDLSFSLGVAADTGEMPSFEEAGARAGYALDYFCRARLLADLLIDTENPTLPDFWTDAIQRNALIRNTSDHTTASNVLPCNLTSLGGGPGFDFVSAALVSSFNSAGGSRNLTPINATILDYEVGWKSLVESMNEATRKVLLSENTISCNWGGICDITESLYHPSNVACINVVETTSIWTCQYCVAENAKCLRESDFVFFRELFQAAAVGSLFIITETTPRLWPEFYKLLLEQNKKEENNLGLKIGFPYMRGPHMVIYKSETTEEDSSVINERDIKNIRHYMQYSQNHEKLMESGWERQKSKRFYRNNAYIEHASL